MSIALLAFAMARNGSCACIATLAELRYYARKVQLKGGRLVKVKSSYITSVTRNITGHPSVVAGRARFFRIGPDQHRIAPPILTPRTHTTCLFVRFAPAPFNGE